MADSNPSIFIDRNSGGKNFQKILVSAGLNVALHDDLFDQNTRDDVWLKEASSRGHVIVTGDKDTTRNPLFLKQLADSRAYVFVIYGLNGASAEGKAGAILAALEKIKELMKSSDPPVLWKIGKDLRAVRCDHQKIIQRIHANRRI